MNKIIIFFIISGFNCIAQQKGILLVTTQPRNVTITINEKKFTTVNTPVEWDTGQYIIKLWAPETNLVIDTFYIKQNQISIIRKRLPFSDDYLSYLQSEAKLKRPLNSSLTGSAILAGLVIINKTFMQIEHRKAGDALARYYQEVSLEGLNEQKSAYDKHHDRYNHYRKINNVILPAAAVLIPAALIVSYSYFRNHSVKYKPKEILLGRITPIIIKHENDLQFGFNYLIR
jgi:hypothetical protein